MEHNTHAHVTRYINKIYINGELKKTLSDVYYSYLETESEIFILSQIKELMDKGYERITETKKGSGNVFIFLNKKDNPLEIVTIVSLLDIDTGYLDMKGNSIHVGSILKRFYSGDTSPEYITVGMTDNEELYISEVSSDLKHRYTPSKTICVSRELFSRYNITCPV